MQKTKKSFHLRLLLLTLLTLLTLSPLTSFAATEIVYQGLTYEVISGNNLRTKPGTEDAPGNIVTTSELTIPNNFKIDDTYYYVKEISEYSFSSETLIKVSFSSAIEKIGDYAFKGCRNVTTFATVGSTITYSLSLQATKSIGHGAFSDCTQLKAPIQISYSGVTTAYDDSFSQETYDNCMLIHNYNQPGYLTAPCWRNFKKVAYWKGNPPDNQYILTVTPETANILQGDDIQLTATKTLIPEDLEVTWSSSDASVATVSSDGLVRAVGKGVAKIKAVCNGTTDYSTITVLAVPVITVSKNAVTLTSGASSVAYATLLDMPEDAEVTWKSSDESVVTVKATQANYAPSYRAAAETTERQAAGLITAVAPGTATVTATCNGKSADVLVSVIDQSEVFNLNTSDPDDPEVKTAQIGLGMELDAKQLMNVKWSSSDPSIADVNENGIVTGVNKGNALITANIGNLTSSFLAVVTDPWVVTEIRGIEATDGDLNSGEGEIELYDLNGLKIDAAKAAPGIYIMRRGTTSTKVRLNSTVNDPNQLNRLN